MDEKSIELVRWDECYRVIRDDGALEDGCYHSEALSVPEHCGCDGNQMPIGHPVFRDSDGGYAVSAEHCDVVAEVGRVDVDELHNATVWVVAPGAINGLEIAGIWYQRAGELVDNRDTASKPWTREVAARALRPEPSGVVRPQEGDLVVSGCREGDVGKVLFVDEDEGIEVQWNMGIESHTWDEVAALQVEVVDQCRECGEVRPDFICLQCGAKVCWYCAEDHACSMHSTSEQQADFPRWTSWSRRLIRLGLDHWTEILVASFIVAAQRWAPWPWNGLALLVVLASVGRLAFPAIVAVERRVVRLIGMWVRRLTSSEVA
jgi:hypothetical protein